MLSVETRWLDAANPAEESAWNEFVQASADGTVFHLSTWRRVVEKVFGHRPRYLYATRAGRIQGVLPMFELRGLLSGHVLVSVPYGVYGGLCGADEAARGALLEAARRLAQARRVRHLELRHLHAPELNLPTKSLYATYTKPLLEDPDANLNAIPGKQRRMVRQGIKHGLESRRGWEALDAFYEVYLVNRRHLGSPPFSRRLFGTIRDEFGKNADLLTVWHRDRLVAGVISLYYGDRVMPYYGAALPEAFQLAANDFMYWTLMREAGLAGYRVFDFGRSREGAGSGAFKRHWGFEPTPLSYQYLQITGRELPNISPSNSRLQGLMKGWKRLPVGVTRWVGPPLTRWLPLD